MKIGVLGGGRVGGTLAERTLGWRPRYELHDMVRSAWRWHSSQR